MTKGSGRRVGGGGGGGGRRRRATLVADARAVNAHGGLPVGGAAHPGLEGELTYKNDGAAVFLTL